MAKFRSINFNGGGSYSGGGGGGTVSSEASYSYFPHKATGAADTPLGITWSDPSGQTFTGTLAPSSNTVGTEYFLWNGSGYDQYITYVTIDEQSIPHYSWVQSGQTGNRPSEVFNLKYINLSDESVRDINNLIYHHLYEED